jgi:hydroxymethylbilane synthase
VRDALAAAVPALAAPERSRSCHQDHGRRHPGPAAREAGGKGLFVKEIEEALLAAASTRRAQHEGHADGAAAGLLIAAFLPREDARDVLIAGDVKRIADLKQGASSAPRRCAGARSCCTPARPQIVNLRGNVDTRLAKREAGEVEATLLALAGLKRLGMAHVGTPVPEDEMLPAVGQGAVCIECRADDARTRAGWPRSTTRRPRPAIAPSMRMLAVLDGSCRTPIAGHAVLQRTASLHLRGLIAKPDGSELIATERRGRRAMPRRWAAMPASN